MSPKLEILAVATKSPWPPVDGGRLALQLTLEVLAGAGHRITLVCPAEPQQLSQKAPSQCCEVEAVPVRRHSLPKALAISFFQRLPVPVARHTYLRIRQRAAELLARRRFDVIHVEQVQAFSNVPSGSKPAVVVRCHNVESDILRSYCESSRRRRILGLTRRFYSEWEGRVVASAEVTICLTTEDAERLQELARGGGRVVHMAVPFPAELPPAQEPLPGDPAVVLLAGQGWFPQRDDINWFLNEVWPRMRLAVPGARLHVFGSYAGLPKANEFFTPVGLPESRFAFDPKAILVVPMRKSFGVRMKVLEAWARGTPVVATSHAIRGLATRNENNLLLADDPEAMAAAIERLHRDPNLVIQLRAAGRETLRAYHDPMAAAERLTNLYVCAATASPESPCG